MRGAFFFPFPTTTTTVTQTFHNDHPTPRSEHNTFQIPVQSPSDDQQPAAAAAVKIQSAYRSHVVRKLVKKISAVNREANYLQRLIQLQETVDAVRSNERERIRINEALMGLLFRLDSVPGVDPTVRDLRRHVSRRIVGLQEILDAVSDAKIESWDGFLRDWDDVLEKIESEVCKERGNGDLERFCAEHLGFRCLQQFLRDN
ncbi:PREDICTED: BAG family molecular chaperone regulator 5, mitochondrial [Ipomoea nil]|uniref:BAG family molecular chaperone regulator 5, mitochondrial n=1 Tax=Ipomoea nil TaxID=35883 RepID=UPI000901D28B|nr:PREDICTED: BAG family molecular chaperone regulator 5, mitochondrial [Ipomoea nil]